MRPCVVVTMVTVSLNDKGVVGGCISLHWGDVDTVYIYCISIYYIYIYYHYIIIIKRGVPTSLSMCKYILCIYSEDLWG